MTFETCTELLREHDPDRFGAVLTARADRRAGLVTLYALNLEIARAPFQSAEPMLAEMRLQWWVDRLAEMGQGIAPPLHDVLTPVWEEWGVAAGALEELAEARRRDCARDRFTDPDAVIEYVDMTAGRLMWQAASWLGVPADVSGIVADQARGAGLATWLRALPQLQPLGLGLAQARQQDAQGLAVEAMAVLRRAARAHHKIPKSVAASLYPGPRVSEILTGIADGRIDCFKHVPEISPFQRRASLAWFALSGRWWRSGR